MGTKIMQLSKLLGAFFSLATILCSTSSYAYSPLTNAVYAISSQTHNLKPAVVQQALNAYNCALARGINDPKHILTIVDYSLPSSEKRLWVVDLRTGKILLNTYVAHAMNSGGVVPEYFSNNPSSHTSSLGLYRTGNAYYGKHGYAVRLYGLEQGFNNNAYSRAIVVHGAWYVADSMRKVHGGVIGRSWGCFAVSPKQITSLANTIRQGTFLFAYYPQSTWLNNSKFLHCDMA